MNALHTAAVEAYGTNYLEDGGDLDYVMLPGIIQSRVTGNLCIALLEIDLMSSGELYKFPHKVWLCQSV